MVSRITSVSFTLGILLVVPISLVVATRRPALGAPAPPLVQALVVSDLGDPAGIVARMNVVGWEVTTMPTLEVSGLGTAALAAYDIVWIPASTNYPALRILVEDGGPVEEFVRNGGTLVVMGVSPDGLWLDVAPGGVEAKALPADGAGPVEIELADHPLITGEGIGDLTLVSSDFDPNQTGGHGTLFNQPEGAGTNLITTNQAGAVTLEYHHGAGHCFVSTSFQERNVCKDNVLLYNQSLVQ